ncbi:MAG: T9SS type A sorting domain-containing protein [bacterium]|nr:T9SS type A sorting domain-containing protein [bacterium]
MKRNIQTLTLSIALAILLLVANSGQTAVIFTENCGQWDARVLYYATGNGLQWWFERDGVTVQATESIANRDRVSVVDMSRNPITNKAHAYRISFEASSPQKSAGKSVIVDDRVGWNNNYFLGDDAKKWATNVPNYRSLTYPDVWPGVDIRYHEQDGNLKYDIVVAPNADPSQVRFRYQGLNALTIDQQRNELVLNTSVKSLRESIPGCWQGSGVSKRSLRASFVLLEEYVVGLSLPDGYDHSKQLVIDPFVFSTAVGDPNVFEVVHDAEAVGNSAIMSGYTSSSTFPVTLGSYDIFSNGGVDVFVTKLSGTGSSLVYSTYIGGAGADYAYGMCDDNTGGVFVTGSTWIPGQVNNFPTTPGVYQRDPHVSYDVFVLHLNSWGNGLIFSTYLGADNLEEGWDVETDGYGGVMVFATTNDNAFPTTPNAYQPWRPNNWYNFFSYLTNDGATLSYSTFFSVAASEIVYHGNDVASLIGGVDDVYTVATTAGAYQTTQNPANINDGYVTKFNLSTGQVIASTYFGFSGMDDFSDAIATGNGSITLVGGTTSLDVPVTGNAYQTARSGSGDGLIVRLSEDLTTIEYCSYFGCSGSSDNIQRVAPDGVGGLLIGGVTYGTGLPVTPNAVQTSLSGQADLFAARFNSNNQLLYSTYLGSSQWDSDVQLVAPYNPSGMLLAGNNDYADFPTTPDAYDPTFSGTNNDIYVTVLDYRYAQIEVTMGEMPVGVGSGKSMGNIAIGSTIDQTFIITNTGDMQSSLTDFEIYGSDSTLFSFLGDVPTQVLANGDTAQFTIRFQADSMGVQITNIRFTNQDALRTPYYFTLTANVMEAWSNGATASSTNPNGDNSGVEFTPTFPPDPNTGGEPPVELAFPNQAPARHNPGSVTASYTTERPLEVHAVQFPVENTISRFWTIEASDNNFVNATLILRFTAADLPVGIADPVHASPPLIAGYTTDGGVTWVLAAGTVTEVAPVPSGIYEMTITGLNHFSIWALGNSGVLPVELSSFTAAGSDRSVVLSWQVESELNNGFYRVYRSTDRNVIGELVTMLPGRGTSPEPYRYTWTDSRVTNDVTYYYRLADVNLDGNEHINPIIASATPSPHAIGIVPLKYALMQNYPNPFNASTEIRFAIRDAGYVRLALYDVQGKEVARLVDRQLAANTYRMVYHASQLSSGIYFLRLDTQKFTTTRKVMFVK